MNGNGTSFFGSDWLGAFLIIAVLFNGGGGLFGGGNNVQSQINDAINNQTTQLSLQQNLLASANNNYETARLINDQTMASMQQNNTNLINAIQGFNQVTGAISAQTNAIQQAIAQLGYQLDSCCCSIKTQMLQDKYDAEVTQRIITENNLSNLNQTQVILNTMGHWVANSTGTT